MSNSDKLLQTIINTAPLRVFWKDTELRFLGCNLAFAKDAGVACPNDLIGKDDYQLAWKEHAERYRADDRHVMESGIPILSYNELQTTPDGGQIWRRTSKMPLRNEADEPIGVLGIYEDITERKLAEDALRESEARFATIFRTSPVATAISRLDDGLFFDVNDAFVATFGYALEEILGRTSLELALWPCAEERENMTRQLHEHGRIRQYEVRLRHRSGSLGCFLFSAELIELHGQQYALGMLSDISDRKRSEEILMDAKEELEHQVRRRTGALMRSNDLLTQEIDDRKRIEQDILDHQQKLQAIALELSLAEERERNRIAGELHDQVGQRLILGKMKLNALTSRLSTEELKSDTKEIIALIDQSIQDIRSLTFQMRPPLLASAGLEAAVQWLGEEFKKDFGLQMAFSDDNKPKPLEYEIRSAIFQVVRELLLNVAKHAGTKHVNVLMKRDDDAIVIIVADNGVGLDNSGAALKKCRQGGFGLFNVRQRIEFLGGQFFIESLPVRGTQATVVVPLDLPKIERGSDHES